MSDLTPITREEALLDGADLEPITRKEQFIKRIYDKTQEIPDPITREEWFLKKAGEGTSPVTIEQLNATENGTYSEPGKAYSPVIVEVPEPTLITKSITENGTYTASDDNADGYSSVTVAVEGFKKKSISNTPTDIASFDDGTANPMPSLEISIEPQQDLHGYDNPWVGGAGANKWDEEWEVGKIDPANGIPITSNDNIRSKNYISVLPDVEYYWYCTANNVMCFYDANKNYISTLFKNPNQSFITPSNTSYMKFYCAATYGTIYNNDISINYPSTVTTYSPYSNICPISGWDEAQITVADDLTTPTETHTTSIPFHDSSDNPVTVYGGTLNVTSGELRVTMVNIASYNGETINEPWISSMDAYSAGTTPTTGAQVVYPLATPQAYQLTPQQVTTLLEKNNIFADCGQVLEGEYFVTL